VAGDETPRALQTRARLMPLVQTLRVLDADGRVMAGSDTGRPSDSPGFFPGLDTLETDGLSLSRPFADPNGKGELITLAIRFAGPRTAKGGWILAAMPAGALLGALGANLVALQTVRRYEVKVLVSRVTRVLAKPLQRTSVARALAEILR